MRIQILEGNNVDPDEMANFKSICLQIHLSFCVCVGGGGGVEVKIPLC